MDRLASRADGSLTVSHAHGHGTVILPADYARDMSASATPPPPTATRATRSTSAHPRHCRPRRTAACTSAPPDGRAENSLLVVTDDPDRTARDILEQVLTNDRADVPAITRRRDLLRQLPATERNDPEQAVAETRQRFRDAEEWAEPHLQPLHDAKAAMDAAQRDNYWAANNAGLRASHWQRPRAAHRIRQATEAFDTARDRYEEIKADVAPVLDELARAITAVDHAQAALRSARITARLDRFVVEPRTPTPEHGIGIEL